MRTGAAASGAGSRPRADGVRGRGSPAAGSGARPGLVRRRSTKRCRSRRGFCGGFWLRAARCRQTGPVPVVSGRPLPGSAGGLLQTPRGGSNTHGEAAAGGCPTGQAPRCGLGKGTLSPLSAGRVPQISFSTLLNGDFFSSPPPLFFSPKSSRTSLFRKWVSALEAFAQEELVALTN